MERSRRNFLLSVAALPLVGGSIARTAAEPTPASDETWLHALSGSMRSVRIVGAEYLSAYPHEADYDLLVGKLDATLQLFRAEDAALLARRIQAQCARDFRQGNVLKVNGCWLSRTELRLCGLAVLRSYG